MKKFIITEQERKHILSLYEQTQPQQFSKFTQDVANILGIPAEQISSIDILNSNDPNLMKQYTDKFEKQVRGLQVPVAKLIRNKQIDNVINQLKNYQGQGNELQKKILSGFVDYLQSGKGSMENNINSMTEEQWNQFIQRNGTSNQDLSSVFKNYMHQNPDFRNRIYSFFGGGSTAPSGQTTNTGTTVSSSGTTTGSTQSQTGEKINTTSDRSFDYKLSNGEYFFKGKSNTSFGSKYPNWTKATGTALDSIKTKIRF